MSLRREARDVEQALQMSRVGTGDRELWTPKLQHSRQTEPALVPSAAKPTNSHAETSGKENLVPGSAPSAGAHLPPPPIPLIRRETEKAAPVAPLATGSSWMSSASPSLHVPSSGFDLIATPPPPLSSPPTSAYTSSLTGPRTPKADQRPSSPLKESLASASRSNVSTSLSPNAKRKRMLHAESGEEEGDFAEPGCRVASPGAESTMASARSNGATPPPLRSDRTEIFVDLPKSSTKRSRAEMMEMSSETSNSPETRQKAKPASRLPASSASSTAALEFDKQKSTEHDDAALAAALAKEDGVALRRASRSRGKPVSYAPVCDKDGRPLKAAIRSASSASASKKSSSDKREGQDRTSSLAEERGPPARTRDEDATDEEDWQRPHGLDSPARDKAKVPRDGSQTSGRAKQEEATASRRVQEATAKARAVTENTAGAVLESSPAGPPTATGSSSTESPASPEETEPTMRRSRRHAEKVQREAEAKAARKKLREERKRREAEERERAGAEVVAKADPKKGGKKKAKVASEKTFDLCTSPARSKKDARQMMDAASSDEQRRAAPAFPTEAEDEGSNSGNAANDEDIVGEGVDTVSPPTGARRVEAASAQVDEANRLAQELAAGGSEAGSDGQEDREAAQAEAEDDEDEDESENRAEDQVARPESAAKEPVTPAKQASIISTPTLVQRASTSVPQLPEPTGSSTPTVSIAHRSNSTPSSSRPSTPGSSSFMGKPLTSLLTPGSSRYGAVRRPGLTRKHKIPSLLAKRGPAPVARPPNVKKKKRGDEDDYEWDEAYERLMGRVKDEDATSDEEGAADQEGEGVDAPDEVGEEAIDEVVDDY